MDKKTKGSWLIHHTNKLQSVTNQSGYEKTYLAGKAGILLSAISANRQLTVNQGRNVVVRVKIDEIFRQIVWVNMHDIDTDPFFRKHNTHLMAI